MRRKQRLFFPVALIVVAAAGCSGDGSAPVLGLPSAGELGADASGGGIPAASTALQGVLTPQDLVVGTPTDVYTRIARGVLTCWFGADGPMKSSYIYHAEADPASKGGRSEIKIMTRDREADDPRALRAYRIAISPSESKTKVEVENVRLPEPLAVRLKADVVRWSKNEEGCGETPVTAGWAANPVIEIKPETKADKKKKP